MRILIICLLAVATCSAFDLRFAELKERNIVVPAFEVEGRITNGKTAAPGQFPYQVGLACQSDESAHWCGGTIISETYILTAAHCTYGVRLIIAYLGATSPRTAAKVKHTIPQEDIITHPKYNPVTVNNDIALIKMPPTPFSKWIQAVKLPARSQSYSTYTGDEAISSGWGKTSDGSGVSNVLKYAYFEIISNKECAATFGLLITSKKICVATPNGTSTCQGDSGGSLVLAKTGEIVGVVSFGSSQGCQAEYPAAFTRVTSYMDWIAPFIA